MQKLAKREAQIMQIIWSLNKASIKEIVEQMPEPRPHYNSVSTMVKLLKSKGFVGEEKLGKAYSYFALVPKEDYQGGVVDEVVDGFFNGSPVQLVNYFAKEQKLSAEDLERILKMIKEK